MVVEKLKEREDKRDEERDKVHNPDEKYLSINTLQNRSDEIIKKLKDKAWWTINFNLNDMIYVLKALFVEEDKEDDDKYELIYECYDKEWNWKWRTFWSFKILKEIEREYVHLILAECIDWRICVIKKESYYGWQWYQMKPRFINKNELKELLNL